MNVVVYPSAAGGACHGWQMRTYQWACLSWNGEHALPLCAYCLLPARQEFGQQYALFWVGCHAANALPCWPSLPFMHARQRLAEGSCAAPAHGTSRRGPGEADRMTVILPYPAGAPRRGQLHHHLVQPQLCGAQRRQPGHARVRDVAGARDRVRDRGRPDVQPRGGHAGGRRRQGDPPGAAARRRAAAQGL